MHVVEIWATLNIVRGDRGRNLQIEKAVSEVLNKYLVIDIIIWP